MTIQTKPLYVLISDGGDGSSYPCYTFDSDFIAQLQKADDDGLLACDNGIGVDGDGFHYSVLNVPEHCTAQSLGIELIDPKEFAGLFNR